MLFGGLTVFFLALSSTAIYRYTPEPYPTEIRATADSSKTPRGQQGLNPVEETEHWRGQRGSDRSLMRARHARSNRLDPTPRV
jgi:hypothetical protein